MGDSIQYYAVLGDNMIFDEKTKILITSQIGDFEILNDHRKDSARTGVVEVLTGDNRRLFVKIHSRLSRWNPEVYAYKNWIKPIENYAPALVADFYDTDVFGIITTPLRCKTVNEAQITDEDLLTRIYYEAGELFKEMQSNIRGTFFGIPKADGTPLDENAKTDPVEYIYDSIETLATLMLDNEILDYSYKSLIEWCLDNCNIFRDDYPAPTNWDLSQNNWMVDDNGIFTGFIDFENMLWSLPLDSFAVMQERYTFDKPHLLDSFYGGYGLVRNELTELKQKILSVNSSMASIDYGHKASYQYFFDCGMRMLKSIKEKHS
jgi:hypothetical protein